MRKHNYGTKYNSYSIVSSLPCINVQLYILIRRVDLIILLDVVFQLSYTLLLSAKKEYVNIHRGSFSLIFCDELEKNKDDMHT